jgi:gluconolactonase
MRNITMLLMWSVGCAIVLLVAALHGQQSPSPPAVHDQQPAPDIPGVIRGGTRAQLVLSGLNGADDPIAWPEGGIIFTEPGAHRVIRLDAADRPSTFFEGLHEPLGMTIDQKGRVFSLQGEDGYTGVRLLWPRGNDAYLSEGFDGKRFSRPNDITIDRRGGLYMSDPGLTAGQLEALRKARGLTTMEPRLPAAVYYIPSGRPAIRVIDNIARPNGVHLSRDEKTLFVNDTLGVSMFAFDVAPDGTLMNQRIFATYKGRGRTPTGEPNTASAADGLVVDNDGRLYAITEAGIEVFDPRGQHLGIIPAMCTAAGTRCQGLAFAGPDKRTLYVAGYGFVWKIAMLAQGFTGRVK